MPRTPTASTGFSTGRRTTSGLEYALTATIIGIAVIVIAGYIGFHVWDRLMQIANTLMGVSDLWATY